MDPESDGYAEALAAAIVPGTTHQAVSGTNEVPVAVEFNPTGTAANTAYRITVAKSGSKDTKNIGIRDLTLTYEKVD